MSQPETRKIRKPIIVLGAARSGTSALGDLVNLHPDVAYWMEPNPVWRHGNAYLPDDVLRAEDLTPRIARYIDEQFHAFMQKQGASRFAEKTPNNTLRVPFIHALFPDCKVVHIMRDGRAVVPSILRREREAPRRRGLRRRVREIPLVDWPSYAPIFFRTVFRTVIRRRQASYWGPRPPGWKDWIGLPAEIRAARQWKACVATALRDCKRIPPENYLELRFEELVEDPPAVLRRVLEFAELPLLEDVVEAAAGGITRGRNPDWREVVPPEMEKRIVDEMNPLLSELGYGDG